MPSPDDTLKSRVVHVNDNVPGAVYVGRANARKKLHSYRRGQRQLRTPVDAVNSPKKTAR